MQQNKGLVYPVTTKLVLIQLMELKWIITSQVLSREKLSNISYFGCHRHL